MSDDAAEEMAVRPEDALQVAQRALSKVNDLEGDLEDLRADHEDVVDELTSLKLRMEEWDDDREYGSLTLNEKIGKVRQHAFKKAVNGHGRAQLDYDDIMWECFDGEPGTKHVYKLMRRAAGESESAQQNMNEGAIGFVVRDPAGENKHLAVDAERAKRSRAFFPENKDSTEEVQIG